MKVIENIAPPRGNGVTVIMGGQIFVTQPPIFCDKVFVQQAAMLFNEYQKGKPRG